MYSCFLSTTLFTGRVNLVDLVEVLCVDHSVIEKRASLLAHSDSSLCFVLGQLISKDYLDAIAEEINEKLQQEGSTTIAELVKSYELPGDFMLEVSFQIFLFFVYIYT